MSSVVFTIVDEIGLPEKADHWRSMKFKHFSAVNTWFLDCQESTYRDEISYLRGAQHRNTNKVPRVRQLGLFLDESGLIRCNGRIHNAPIPESAEFPYLIPANHPLTRLIVLDAHEQLLHSGMNATVTYIRQTFWIPTIRQYATSYHTDEQHEDTTQRSTRPKRNASIKPGEGTEVDNNVDEK
ncbi:Hypothetical predicted protein [Mytilus galloprovincialis]|uniref:Integrase zinc-binding domain-containing protein n=1 Tax=Mytilus galloprovincialis TaxID=29158 RepID=A0A8B6EQ06_MYTGA|nr:Hypothetical predicted protein [Mytilus galloprovincialis]